jgi:two-component system sensor histidine kinase KdpD
MTRLESSVIEPRLEWCDVHDIVTGALEATGEIFRGRDFAVRAAGDLPLVKTDHALLEQALANLLHNASVHTPPGTAVELTVARRGESLDFIVRDHGKGIAAGEEMRIFGKFYRSPGAAAGGTGLGLSIAKGFLRALGGEIVARNHPAGGAEFTIRLPAETMEHAAVAET